MEQLQNRHDLTDAQWNRIEPIIKQHLNKRGGSNANDNRVFVNACLWIVRTGSPWRDLPPQYGKFNAVHRRYKRWCDNHIGEYILAELITEPDYEWLMIDASHCKAPPHACRAKKGGNQAIGRTRSTPSSVDSTNLKLYPDPPSAIFQNISSLHPLWMLQYDKLFFYPG